MKDLQISNIFNGCFFFNTWYLYSVSSIHKDQVTECDCLVSLNKDCVSFSLVVSICIFKSQLPTIYSEVSEYVNEGEG